MGERRGSGVDELLAQCGELPDGLYRELPPAEDLRDAIACGWLKVVRKPRSEAVPILPDGCVDILACDE